MPLFSPALPANGNWTLVNTTGTPISSGATWTHSGDVTSVPVTGLGNYTDLYVMIYAVTASVSSTRVVRVSTNGGSTYYSTSGEYLNVLTNGTTSARSTFGGGDTNGTTAQTVTAFMPGINVAGPKLSIISGATSPIIFIADNNNNIDAIQLENAGGGNLTGGSFYVYAR